jgi:hypothetical protein
MLKHALCDDRLLRTAKTVAASSITRKFIIIGGLSKMKEVVKVPAALFLKKLTAAKKVSRVDVKLEDVESFFYTIACINNLHWDETQFKGRQLVDWKIDSSFADFILPSKVALSPSRNALDLMYKVEMDHSLALSYTDFDDIMSQILAPFKVENTSRDTNVLDQRKAAVITDVLNRVANLDGRAVYLGEPYMPIVLNFEGFRAGHYNADVQEVMEEFIIEWTHRFARNS